MLSDAAILPEDGTLYLQTDDPDLMNLAVYPSPGQLLAGNKAVNGSPDGIFTQYPQKPLCQPAEISIKAEKIKEAGPKACELKGTDEDVWQDAAVWTFDIPADAARRNILLHIHYTADAARLYVGDTLFDDNYFNGDPFDIGLWRIPAEDWPAIRLKVLPYSEGLLKYLPADVREKVSQIKAAGTVDNVTVTASERLELRISQSQD